MKFKVFVVAAALAMAAERSTAQETSSGTEVLAERKADAEVRKLEAEAAKAAADAKKSKVDADKAEVEAVRGVLPASGKTSTVTAKEAAGQVEAALLANRELTQLTAQAAADIHTAIARDCGRECQRRTILIMGPTDDIQLARLRMFALRRAIVVRALERANKTYNDAKLSKPIKPAGPGYMAFVPVAAATSVVQLANLASYFAASSEIGGVSVDPNDQALIAALVANLKSVCSLNDVYIASRTGTPAASQKVVGQLIELDELVYSASQNLADAKTRAANAKKGKEGEAAAEAAKPWDDVAANLAKAIDGYNGFVAILSDEKGGMPLSAVLREQALGDLLDASAHAYQVFPNYVVAGGGYYSQTSLWTMLGSLPFHVSGGSGISYAVLRASDGAVLQGGTLEGETSYVRVREISGRLKEAKTFAKASDGCSTDLESPKAAVPRGSTGQ